MAGFSLADARVRAVLGPTNTGKTHLAIERMLAHATGIIGFPLRLLARENYDRMVAAKGAARVALITGEEKIVPPDARWFSCTTEAMPVDRAVEFLAVDEIQLCADPDRGHLFTQRLLHARGLVETMFLGAATIRPLIRQLVPHAVIETRPRLSRLVHSGPAKLLRLPPRSAVVAFSAAEVYAIAEAIRRRRGGCAVVMGRLSPRTRNAQVALYQDKEVDFLVATDAIGMGLNMDVDHVAFAGLRKFDGHRPRRLQAAELAQIAGRAGRGMRDGTFGTTAEGPPLDEELAEAVESHQFDPIEQLYWRNADLDFTDGDRLLASLNQPPPRRGLVRGADGSDLLTLATLLRDPDIHAAARGRSRVRLLWDSCQIPDFRKLYDDTHARLCGRVFNHLVKDGALPPDWIGGQIAALSRIDGDLDTLMARLSGVRVWSYIAAHGDWLRNAAHWQDQARQVEDKLSDALHERLLSRFVDRRSTQLLRRLDQTEDDLLAAVTTAGAVIVEGHPVGHISGFAFIPDPGSAGEERKLVLRAARRALRDEMARRVGLLEAAPDTALSLRADHMLCWNDAPIGRLRAGPDLLHPRIVPTDSEYLDGARDRVQTRLQRFVTALIETRLAPLYRAVRQGDADPALRGVLHRLVEAGGLLPGATGADIPSSVRAKLKAIGVRAGRFALWMPALIKPQPMALRAQFWAIHHDRATPTLPDSGLISIPAQPWPNDFAAAIGWLSTGPALIRIDIAERMAAELHHLARAGAVIVPADLAGRLQLRPDTLPEILQAMGFRSACPDMPSGQFGPPTPMTIRPAHLPRHDMRVAPASPNSPFASLAILTARRSA